MAARLLAMFLVCALAGCNGFVVDRGKIRNRQPGDPVEAAPAEESARFLASGLAKADKNDLRGAAIDLDRAVGLQPKSLAVRVARASVRDRLGDAEGGAGRLRGNPADRPGLARGVRWPRVDECGPGKVRRGLGRPGQGAGTRPAPAGVSPEARRDPHDDVGRAGGAQPRRGGSRIAEGRRAGLHRCDRDPARTAADLRAARRGPALLGYCAAERDVPRGPVADAERTRPRTDPANLDVLRSRTSEMRPDPAPPKRN